MDEELAVKKADWFAVKKVVVEDVNKRLDDKWTVNATTKFREFHRF